MPELLAGDSAPAPVVEETVTPQQEGAPIGDTNPSAPIDTAPTGPISTGTWLDGIDQTYRDDETFKTFGSVNELAKSYVNARSLIGRKNGIPDFETASDEVIGSFKESLGAPKTIDGYKIDLPEGFTKDDSFDAFLGSIHKGHVPQDVANELFAMGQQQTTAGIEAYKQTQEDAINTSFSEFTSDPRFQEISVNTKNLLSKVDPNGEFLTADDLGSLGPNAPKVARLLDRLATMTGGDSVLKQGSEQTSGTREEGISKIYADVRAGRISKETGNARREQLNASYGY